MQKPTSKIMKKMLGVLQCLSYIIVEKIKLLFFASNLPINPLYPVDVCTRHPYTGPEIRMKAVDVIASGDFQHSRLDSTNAHRPVTLP